MTSGHGGNRRELLGWYLYDFANTSFTVVIVTVAYAIYFRTYVVGDLSLNLPLLGSRPVGEFLWGAGNSLSMLLVGLSSPYLGAIADSTARKKLFTAVYTLACVLPTALMVTVGAGDIVWGLLLFVLGNIGFQGGLVFYNAFLPQISPPGRIGTVSGVGFAWGYVGALASLLIALPFANRATELGDYGVMAPLFVLSALFFALFAVPFFLFVRERPATAGSAVAAWRAGWHRVRETLGHLHRYRQTARFLLAYFIYSDGINTVIAFGGIYALYIGLTATQVIVFFAVIQLAAIGGAWSLGRLTDRWGARPTIELTLGIWVAMTLLAFLTRTVGTFYAVGVLAGVAMGSSQAASRALMAELTPANREAEFYGFYGLCGKFSAILGTIVYGLVSMLAGSQRWAVLSITLFFVVGWILLRRVDVARGRAAIAGVQ